MKGFKRIAGLVLAVSVVCSMMPADMGIAAKKATLKTKKVVMIKGEKASIKIKKKQKKAAYKYVSSKKKIAAVSKKGVITAKAEGKAVITVKETLNKKTRLVGKVKVTVNPVPVVITPAPVIPTVAPTEEPTPEPTPEPTATYRPISEFRDNDDWSVPQNFEALDGSVAGTAEYITYPSTAIVEGRTINRNAWVILPKDYDESKKYPVVYMNHGIFGNENTMYGCHVQNVLWNAIANGDAEEMIMVLPNGCANETGTDNGLGFNVVHYKAYDNFLNDFEQCLKPYIDENYSTLTDRANTAICGFSMGGRVTLHLGFALQDTFRYVGAFCPAPGIFDFSDMGVTDVGLFKRDEFTLKDEYMDDTLVMIVKGKNDGTVHKFPKEYHDQLVANDVPHMYIETMGGYNETGDGGHGDPVFKFGLYNFVSRIFKLY